jgi:hypothetical protein
VFISRSDDGRVTETIRVQPISLLGTALFVFLFGAVLVSLGVKEYHQAPAIQMTLEIGFGLLLMLVALRIARVGIRHLVRAWRAFFS